MKKTVLLLAAGMLAAVIYAGTGFKTSDVDDTQYEFPEDVKAVIDKSCYGCHSIKGKSDDAKNALRWDSMDEYDKKKMLSVLDGIIEVIEKREMPPKKFLEKMPEAQPSAEEYGSLMQWAEMEAEKLLQ